MLLRVRHGLLHRDCAWNGQDEQRLFQEKQHLQHQNLDRILIYLMETSSILPNCICSVFYTYNAILPFFFVFLLIWDHFRQFSNTVAYAVFFLYFTFFFNWQSDMVYKSRGSKIQSIPFLGEIRPKRSFWPPECLSLSKRLLKKGGLVLFGKCGSPHLLPWIDQIFVGVQSPSFNKTNTPMKVLFLGKQKGLLYYLVQYRNWLFFCWLPAKSRGNINGVLGIPRLPGKHIFTLIDTSTLPSLF